MKTTPRLKLSYGLNIKLEKHRIPSRGFAFGLIDEITEYYTLAHKEFYPSNALDGFALTPIFGHKYHLLTLKEAAIVQSTWNIK